MRLEYPTIKANIETRALSAEVRQHLLAEIADSRYTRDLPSVKVFIESAMYHMVASHPEVGVSLNMILPSVTHVIEMRLQRWFRRATCLLRSFRSRHPFITVWLIPAPAPRTFPRRGEEFDAYHINGGYTYVNNPTIYIYRIEEMPKVLLHELLHNTEIDTRWGSTVELERIFGLETPVLPNEAVVETWAEICHCWCVARELRLSFTKLITIEQQYAAQQGARVLAYQRKYFSGGWREKTNAFAYFVFRAILLRHWREFMLLREPTEITALILKGASSMKWPFPKGASGRMTRLGDI
jgi:hypothetical protein